MGKFFVNCEVRSNMQRAVQPGAWVKGEGDADSGAPGHQRVMVGITVSPPRQPEDQDRERSSAQVRLQPGFVGRPFKVNTNIFPSKMF